MKDTHLTHQRKCELLQLLQPFRNSFDCQLGSAGRAMSIQHSIDTETVPSFSAQKENIQEQVDEMLRNYVVQPSSSQWASPVALVRRKDRWQFCIDYRNLNKITKDTYLLPRIDDALDSLYGAQYFSSLDMPSIYWQIVVDHRD